MTGQPEQARFHWCFSTLGCPELSLPEACALAAEFHLPRLELRSLSNTVQLPELFASQGWSPARVGEIRRASGVDLAVAGASFKLVSDNEAERAELVRFCDWADTLQIPYVRVFGGGSWGTPLTPQDYQLAVRNVGWWREEQIRRGWRLEMLLETHDAFSASSPCLRLNERLSQPLALIWDSHHTWRYGGETPAESWRQLGQLTRHVHIKDSIDRPSARHPFTYVQLGEGQMPLAEVVNELRVGRFQGSVSLEWEKLWHPYLPPLREALARMQTQAWFFQPGQAVLRS